MARTPAAPPGRPEGSPPAPVGRGAAPDNGAGRLRRGAQRPRVSPSRRIDPSLPPPMHGLNRDTVLVSAAMAGPNQGVYRPGGAVRITTVLLDRWGDRAAKPSAGRGSGALRQARGAG